MFQGIIVVCVKYSKIQFQPEYYLIQEIENMFIKLKRAYKTWENHAICKGMNTSPSETDQ